MGGDDTFSLTSCVAPQSIGLLCTSVDVEDWKFLQLDGVEKNTLNQPVLEFEVKKIVL